MAGSQTEQVVDTLKKQLKARGITYRAVAQHLGLSEPSVKRQFSQRRLRLDTLEAIADRAGLDLAELVRMADADQARTHRLSAAQEADLVADPRRLLVAVCVLNHMSLEQITAKYRLSRAEGLAQLLRLDRLKLIALLPDNRVKLKIARDFDWLPDGPIQRYFREHVQTDFLDSPFAFAGEYRRFANALLTPAANLRLQQRLARLVQELAELHADSADAPEEERYGTSLLVALRPWELPAFDALRRSPDRRTFLAQLPPERPLAAMPPPRPGRGKPPRR